MSRFGLGLVVLVFGAVLLLVGGISYTTQDRTPIGPIAIEYRAQHRIPYSPLAGALLAVTGGALMIAGRAKSHPSINFRGSRTWQETACLLYPRGL
jgi:hypothetical protein